MEGEFLQNSADCTKGEYSCELCVLEFTSENEFEEHTWSMLHNTNLNRQKGRDCIHSCSLCKQEFVGLLVFTDHLHSESHLENLLKWEKNQDQRLSPDQQQPKSPNHHQKARPPPDWTADDFGGFVEYFSDNAIEGSMGDNWRGRRGSLRHPRDIPSLLDSPQQYRYRHEEQFERRRDHFPERGLYPPWKGEGRDRPREFRDTPPWSPDMNYSNQENWSRNFSRERYYENREHDWYGTKELYRGDGQRPPHNGEPELRSRRDNQPRFHDNRQSRRNSNSPHTQNKQIESVIGSVRSSRKDDERRSTCTSNKTERYSSSGQKGTPPSNKQTQQENESNRKTSTEKTPPKSNNYSPPSGSPSGKSARKGKPRKLARPVEENKDEMSGADSSGKDAALVKAAEGQVVRLRSNTLEITVKGKDKAGAGLVSPVESRSGSTVIKGDTLTKSECATKQPSCQGESAQSLKKDTSTTPTGVISTSLKGDSSSASMGGSLPTLETNKGLSVIPDKDNSVKVSKKQKDVLLSHKGKDVIPGQSKGNKGSVLSSPDKGNPVVKESSVSGSNVQGNPSRNAKDLEETVAAFRGKHPQSSNMQKTFLSATLADPSSNSNDKYESSLITNQSFTSSETKEKEDMPNLNRKSNSKEKTLDGNVTSSGGQKFSDQAEVSTMLPNMSLSQLEEREDKLRSLLGIKKERKDSEEKEDTASCAATKCNKATRESEERPSVLTNTSSVRSGSVKPAASRYLPVLSQLSLSRPQCSFVHIDGVQCGAVTWNKYCSYHQRVFKGDENSPQEKGLTSKASQETEERTLESESSRRCLIGRPGGTRIFQPNTPPRNPSKHLVDDSRLDLESRYKSSSLRTFGASKESGESDTDLNPTSSSEALTSTVHREAPSGNIDLSTTVQSASANLLLRGSSPDINSDRSTSPRLDNSSGSRVGVNRGVSTGTELSDTVGRPETMALHGNIPGSDSSPDIDLSGTVPNLEGLLALHGSSAGDTKAPLKIDSGKTALKHGRSWKNQGTLGDNVSNTGLGVTGVKTASSAASDSGRSIDLNETVPQPERSRLPHELAGFDPKEAQKSNVNQYASGSSVTSLLRSDVHPNLQLVKTEPGLEKETTIPVQNTEMIDLNYSTKLLGVPHSVVAPFHTIMPSPKKQLRELTKSPSEISAKSSVFSAPRSPAASSPQNSLTSGRVPTTSPLPHDQSSGSTVSLPSLSLDLSRFNLPPAVRKALADRYGGKKTTEATIGHSVELPEGRRSQPLFSEHKTDEAFDSGTKASALPARLRARGQRSISLDSTIVRRENTDGSSRSGLFERGNIFDTHHFLNRRMNNDGRHPTGLPSLDNIAVESSTAPSLGVQIPSTKVPPFNAPSQNASSQSSVSKQEESDELQSRGLIDLSSTSYLEGMAGRRPTDAPRLNVDDSRSPPRPSVNPPSRGLIDLNSSVEYGARETPMDSSLEGIPLIKRKRLDSSEGLETGSSFGDKTVKRPRQEDTTPGDDKAVTYRSGINVQELLTIEREEQNHLQNLHAVQARLKSVRAKIQKLCTELDSLSSEEQRITLRMGELRSMRLSILEHACYERRGLTLPARFETVPIKETVASATQVCRDNNSAFVMSSEGKTRENNTDTFVNGQRKMADDSINSSQVDTQVDVVKTPTSDYCEVSMDKEPVVGEGKTDGNSFVCSSKESSLNSRDVNQCVDRFSPVATAAKLISNEEGLQRIQPGEKVQERPNVEPKREALAFELQDKVFNEQHNKGSGKKGNHSQPSGKTYFRKRSFSDVNVSKTIETSRKKIASVRENIKRWKQQQEGVDTSASTEDKSKQHSGNYPSSSAESVKIVAENPCKEKAVSSPCKIQFEDKSSPWKTTKELKKSSLFHSGKKRSKGSRKNRGDRSQTRDKQCRQREGAPSKRRKLDYNSCNTHRSVPPKEKTSSGKGQVVCAAAHTTTADPGGSGSEERASIADEIPTRDVDSQSDSASRGATSRVHLQIPSSTVQSLKKTQQKVKEGKKHRSPPARKFEGHKGAVCGLKAHNAFLFSCSADKTTKSFNIQTGECVKIYQGHHQAVNCVEISEDKERLFTGSNDQTVRSYNIKSGICSHRFTFDGRVMCLRAAFGLLFVGLNTGIVALIDVTANKLLDRLPCHEPRGVSCLTTATEGQRKLLCCGSFDSTITIRDYKSGLLIRTFNDHTMTILCLQVVDNILYSGSADMKVQAHNLNTGELIRSFEGHTRSVSGLQIVGRVLVTSCLDKLIRCFDLTTGDLLQVYGGQVDMIFSVLVSNGRIFSGGRDGSVVTAKLDLRVYHPCKWNNCKLNFGIASHLKDHIKEYHVIEQGTVEACHWFQCGHQFSADDDISTVLMHVLGHVSPRTARKSAC